MTKFWVFFAVFVSIVFVGRAEANCAEPKTPKNGYIESDGNNKYGGVRDFRCFDNATMDGEPSGVVQSLCLKDGSWSDPVPTCTLKPVVCSGEPTIPANSVSWKVDDKKYEVRCKDGFKFEGKDYTSTIFVTCVRPLPGKWTTVTDKCVEVTCGSKPNLPANGTVLKEINKKTYRVGCKDGFRLEGSYPDGYIIVTCQKDGRWSDISRVVCSEDEDSGCGSPMRQTGLHGSFSSMNWPGNYNNRASCRWIISVPEGYKIRVHFNNPFRLESGSYCGYDSVSLFKERPVTSPSGRIGMYCGTSRPGNISTTDNQLIVIFKTDGSRVDQGFSLDWTAIESIEDSGCGSPMHQTGLHGSFSSMNWPGYYNNRASCRWNISVPEGYIIRVHFNNPFRLERHENCQYDSVSLFEEGPVTSPSGRIGVYCGVSRPGNISTTDNQLIVIFKTDSSGVYPGFSLDWTAIVPLKSGCGGLRERSGRNGSIASMNFPSSYENNADCSWVIRVPPGMRVRLSFNETKFEVEKGPEDSCGFDNVTVRRVDALGNLGRSYRAFCGYSPPSDVIVSDDGVNLIAVTFQSDKTATFSGFSINWIAIYACGAPEVPANGSVSLSDKDKVNSKATYRCDRGFRLVGQNRQCQSSWRWSGSAPKCVEKRCGILPAPHGGSVSLSDEDRVDSTATYTCSRGFRLHGTSKRQCLDSTESWSGESPICEEIRCGSPDIPANGTLSLSNEDRVDSSATYACDPGFSLVGERQRVCLEMGNWSFTTPYCHKVQTIRCGPPGRPGNGSVFLSDDDQVGSIATYACSEGFILEGNSERKCNKTGNWTGDIPVCQEIRCGEPGVLTNGKVSLSSEDKVGSKATFTCNDGFKLVGTTERTCLSTGKWNGDVPKCEEIRCGEPGVLTNGKVSQTSEDKVGSKATYTCNDGFKLVGTTERQCLSQGKWSGDVPKCEGNETIPVKKNPGQGNVGSQSSRQASSQGSWIPYSSAYYGFGILAYVLFSIVVICGAVYGLWRILRKKSGSSGSQEAYCQFENPSFQSEREQESQIS